MSTASNTAPPDRHEELRALAHEDVLLLLQAASAQGLKPGTFAICLFDGDDPNLPDPYLKDVNRDGYVGIVFHLNILQQALAEMDMPAPSLGLLWSARGRKWVTSDGKPASPKFALHYPFADIAKSLGAPVEPGVFLVVTFVGGEVAVFHAVLDVREPLEDAAGIPL